MREEETVGGHMMMPQDAASYLGMSRSWLYHAVETGTLDHIRIGGALRFDRRALDRYIARHTHKAKAHDARLV